jgi:TPP-dependent pyruvate/acetoin dehydrogenase alpha subunit
LEVADMQLTGEPLVKVHRSMCTIREFEERVHKEFATGQIFSIVHRCASTHRGHGQSIKEEAQS